MNCQAIQKSGASVAKIHVLRQNMDTGQFERIWNSGRALTMEQAVGFALGEADDIKL